MSTKELVIIVINAVLVLAILLGVMFERLPWGEAMIALGLVLTPSAGGVVASRFGSSSAGAPPPEK